VENRSFERFAREGVEVSLSTLADQVGTCAGVPGGAGEAEPQTLSNPCPCCGGRMIIIETFERGCTPRHRPTVPTRIDSS
jgi:hypothetical protein